MSDQVKKKNVVVDLSKVDAPILRSGFTEDEEIRLYYDRIYIYQDLCDAAQKKDLSRLKSLMKKARDYGIDHTRIKKPKKMQYASWDIDEELFSIGRLKLEQCAAEGGDMEIVKYLEENGYNFNISSKNAPIRIAYLQNHKPLFHYFLDKGISPNTVGYEKEAPLICVAYERDDMDTVNLLLKKGFDLRLYNSSIASGHSPALLALAIIRDDIEFAKKLLTQYNVKHSRARNVGQADSGMTKPDGYYHSAIHLVAQKGNIELLKLLIRLGVDMDAQTFRDFERMEHQTALHIACQEKHIEIVKYLLANGADYRIKDVKGKTAVGYAPEYKTIIEDGPFIGIEDYVIESCPKRYVNYKQLDEQGEEEKALYSVKAVRRIMRDLKEIMEEPFQTIQVYPIPNNIFKWHITITTPQVHFHPYKGVKFHMVMIFPQDYPHSPPKVSLSTDMDHPNVFGGYICLDMLSHRSQVSGGPNYTGGWTAAYTAHSILMQLQAFLFDENVPQSSWGSSREIVVSRAISSWSYKWSICQIRDYKCNDCGYNVTFNAIDEKYFGHSMAFMKHGLTKKVDKQTFDKRALEKGLNDNQKKRLRKQRLKSAKAPEVPQPKIDEHLKPKQLDNGLTAAAAAKQSSIFADIMDPGNLRRTKNKEPDTEREISIFESIPEEVIVKIFDNLKKPLDLSRVFRVCKKFLKISTKYRIWTRRELICFFSKRSFTEDVIGVGVHVERHKSDDRNLKTLSSPLDMISYRAFYEDDVREAVWGQKFEYFLPLLLDRNHTKRAVTLIKATLVAIKNNEHFNAREYNLMTRYDVYNRLIEDSAASRVAIKKAKLVELENRFDPLFVLEIFPRLMNHMVVAFMKEDNHDNGIVPLHTSERALLGYCSFHHLLLNFCDSYPIIRQTIDHRVKEFLSHDSKRVKLVTPDLGELLVYLSVSSSVSWEQIAIPFLQEFYDRIILWILDHRHGNHGELAYLEKDEVSQYRLDRTFEAAKTSLRLLMFQVFFLKFVGKPEGKSSEKILSDYFDSYGFPAPGMPLRLQRACKKIHSIKTWKDFYQWIGIRPPSQPQMTTILRNAVIRSDQKGYHKNRNEEEQLLKWRKRLEPSVNQSVHSLESQEKEQQPQPQKHRGHKIFVRNLSYQITEEILREAFCQFGNIRFVSIPTDQGRSKGIGFVEFDDPVAAQTAVEYSQNRIYLGRPMQVSLAVDKRRPVAPNKYVSNPNEPPQEINEGKWETAKSKYVQVK